MKKHLKKHIACIAAVSAAALTACFALACAPTANGDGDDDTDGYEPFVELEADWSGFNVSSADGTYSFENGVLDITSAGTYTCSGSLIGGHIEVNAADTDAVIIELNGATIKSAAYAPICIMTADEVDISAQKGTENGLYDLRTGLNAVVDDGVIYSECDLTLKGKGALTVESTFKLGVHTKNDLTVKNLSLSVKSPFTALKGNDSLKLENATLTAISTEGDALKTSDSDISSKGKQRGSITVSGGRADLYAAYDGIDAAYDFTASGGATINIRTDFYSQYTASPQGSAKATAVMAPQGGPGFPGGPGGPGGPGFPGGPGGMQEGNPDSADESCKGIKAHNSITLGAASTTVYSYDDGIHAKIDTELENGATGVGSITVTDGTVTVTTSDDGIHADGDLTVTGGTVNVLTSHEGLEANRIFIKGGSTTAYANDDAANAMRGPYTPYIEVSGGRLDLTVPSGDTDTMDSNGNIKFTGGVTVLRNGQGGSSMTGGTIDCDGTLTATGGVVIAIGCVSRTVMGAKTSTTTTLAAGEYAFKTDGGDTVAEFTLTSSYKGYMVYAYEPGTYSLFRDVTSVLTFTF